MAEEIINNGKNGAGTDEATFTQADVDRIVSQRPQVAGKADLR